MWGKVKIEDMKDDTYIYDETRFCLKGTSKKKMYRLGDNVSVIVKNASKEAKTIDFELAPLSTENS